MTNEGESRECLQYYYSGTKSPMGTYGHEYVRCVRSIEVDMPFNLSYAGICPVKVLQNTTPALPTTAPSTI